MDQLSHAMQELRVRSVNYQRDLVRAPSHLTFEERGSAFHFIASGQGVLSIGDMQSALEEGDLVLLPRGIARSISPDKSVIDIVTADLEWVAGDHPVLDVLPTFLTAPRPTHIDALLDELDHPERAGAATLLVRFTDVLLVQAMRSLPAPRGTECPVNGWVTGLSDAILAPVLARIHEEPGGPWTVASLAELAGQSRSAFAAHFAAVMSEPPMAYLARWRMFRARSLLRETQLALDTIAEKVGYGSAAAFSLAFTREHGMTPGAFRKTEAPGVSPPLPASQITS